MSVAIWLLGLIGVLVVFCAAMLLAYRRVQRKNGLLREENIRLIERSRAQQENEAQFENIANRVLAVQNTKSREEIEKTLTPLREKINEFRNRMEDISKDTTKDRAELRQHIGHLMQAHTQLSQDAENLTQALRNDKKQQGDWGEMTLERLLEQSGLQKGREYELQPAYKNDEGDRLRPDAVVHLPENKHIVIDAKVSLNAYVAYNQTEDEEQSKRLLDEHINVIKNHINALSSKDYARLVGLNSLEYVLLFFAVEPAFILAQREDPSLFEYGLRRRIILVTPATLLATLRVIHNIWRNEKRNKNAEEIARQAGAMYDKLHGFLEDMTEISKSLTKAQQSVDAAQNKLAQGKGNLLSRAEKIKELGADTKKQLPDSL